MGAPVLHQDRGSGSVFSAVGKHLGPIALVVATLLGPGCQGDRVGRMGDATPMSDRASDLQTLPLRPLWRTHPDADHLTSVRGQERAGAAYDHANNRLFIGSTDGHFRCLRASDGHVLWKTEIAGGVRSHAILHRGLVYVGSDSGNLVALRADTGETAWTYRVQGAITEPPTIHASTVYFVDGTNAVYALGARNGAWKWQHRREQPARFAVAGESGITVADDRVYVGFSDGNLMAFSATDGAVLWTRNLAENAPEFRDVDATPTVIGDTLYAASLAGGVYALDPVTGKPRWRRSLTNVVQLSAYEGDLLVSRANGEIHRLAPKTGVSQWRVDLGAAAGPPGPIVPLGNRLTFTVPRGGLYILDGATGRPQGRFRPGGDVSARPTTGKDGRLFLLSQAGVLYAFGANESWIKPKPTHPLSSSPGRGLIH